MERAPETERPGAEPGAAAAKPHPDRLATTLAQRAVLGVEAFAGPFQQPGAGSADARVDLKLMRYRVRRALEERGTEAARARFFRPDLQGADLLAGTVQDGTARGYMLALEETLSLCVPARGEDAAPDDPDRAVFEGAELRRKRDILVASGAARVRFSRKRGILLVDRAHGLHVEDSVWFEDRRDAGTLDGFEPVTGERARVFRAGFLQPRLLEQGRARDRLVLCGRLGRRAAGFPCRLVLEGRKDEKLVRMTVAVHNLHEDHRLRIRFMGMRDPRCIAHEGTPGWERVAHPGGTFVAATLVRACGRLLVGARAVAVPGAQCPGWIEHRFRLGGAAAEERSGSRP